LDEKRWEAMSKRERNATVDETFTYDDKLARSGHRLDSGQARQSARKARTRRLTGVKVVVTDGPFAETKELLGGIGTIAARHGPPGRTLVKSPRRAPRSAN
jgi:hypothetical protein